MGAPDTLDRLDTVAGQIKARLSKSADLQISAELQIAEARRRVVAGEAGPDVSWQEWAERHLGKIVAPIQSPIQAAAGRLDTAVAEVHAAIAGYLGVCAKANGDIRSLTGRSNARFDGAGDCVKGLVLANDALAALCGVAPTAGAQPSLLSQHPND